MPCFIRHFTEMPYSNLNSPTLREDNLSHYRRFKWWSIPVGFMYIGKDMTYVRHKNRSTLLVRLIALAVILRSFIAPGFMLGVSADGGLSIMFCNGPAGVHAQYDGHGGHSHHHDDQGAGNSGHVTPACTHWSTSGSFVVAVLTVPLFSAFSPDQEKPSTPPTVVPSHLDSARVTRGPPTLI